MAKQSKVLPARKTREPESLLLRSAESLGRMIGSLQRQLDDASRKIPNLRYGNGKSASAPVSAPAKSANRRQRTSAGSSRPTKERATADNKSKRASKSAAAKKTAPRSRSGARRRTRQAARHA